MVPPAREPLDPALRARLLQEARTPWRGLRRGLWLAFTASAGVGLAAMALRASAGGEVAGSDLLIQVSALGLFGLLLWKDRSGPVDGAGLTDGKVGRGGREGR